MSVFSKIDPNKIIRKVEKEVKKVGKKVKSEVEGSVKKVGMEVEGSIKMLGHEIETQAKKVGHEIEGKIEDAADEAVDKIKDAAAEVSSFARKAFSEIEGAILSAAVKDAAQKALAVAKLGPQTVDFSVQAVVGIAMTFSVDEVLSYFQQVIDNPPHDEKGLLEFIRAAAPTEVRVYAGGELSLGIQVAVEAGCTFKKDELIENWGEVIKAFS